VAGKGEMDDREKTIYQIIWAVKKVGLMEGSENPAISHTQIVISPECILNQIL
jgi:hypothetical protein